MSRSASALSFSLSLGVALAAGFGWTGEAQAATDDVEVEIREDEDGDVEVVEVIETHDDHHHDETWGGVFFGTVLSPYKTVGPAGNRNKRVTSNQAQGCLDPTAAKLCGNLRGFDARLVLFEAGDRRDNPRAVGYFRTGYTGGRVNFNPANSEEGFADGTARNLSYFTVPLFFGGNVYFLKNLPVRPYAGMGAGFDVLRVNYDRHEKSDLVDASARIGFELHAGIEARITNYVALSAEVQQLWSARRKLDGVPDFSNEGMSFIAGVTLAIPTAHSRHHRKHRVKTVRKVKRVVKPTPVVAPTPPVAPAAPPAAVAQPAPVPATLTGPNVAPAPPAAPVAPAPPAAEVPLEAPAAAPAPTPAE